MARRFSAQKSQSRVDGVEYAGGPCQAVAQFAAGYAQFGRLYGLHVRVVRDRVSVGGTCACAAWFTACAVVIHVELVFVVVLREAPFFYQIDRGADFE